MRAAFWPQRAYVRDTFWVHDRIRDKEDLTFFAFGPEKREREGDACSRHANMSDWDAMWMAAHANDAEKTQNTRKKKGQAIMEKLHA